MGREHHNHLHGTPVYRPCMHEGELDECDDATRLSMNPRPHVEDIIEDELDGCNDDSVRKFPKSDLEKGWIISNEYKFYIPPTCQTFVSLGSHCNCLSTTTDWQFSIEKGNPKTLYYLYLLHIQKPSLAFPKAVFLL